MEEVLREIQETEAISTATDGATTLEVAGASVSTNHATPAKESSVPNNSL